MQRRHSQSVAGSRRYIVSVVKKVIDFSGESFFNCCKRLMHFFKTWSRDKL